MTCDLLINLEVNPNLISCGRTSYKVGTLVNKKLRDGESHLLRVRCNYSIYICEEDLDLWRRCNDLEYMMKKIMNRNRSRY